MAFTHWLCSSGGLTAWRPHSGLQLVFLPPLVLKLHLLPPGDDGPGLEGGEGGVLGLVLHQAADSLHHGVRHGTRGPGTTRQRQQVGVGGVGGGGQVYLRRRRIGEEEDEGKLTSWEKRELVSRLMVKLLITNILAKGLCTENYFIGSKPGRASRNGQIDDSENR